MSEFSPRHVVFVRHGESEGDVRRKNGMQATRHPKDEEQTKLGHEQSVAAGQWIVKYVLEHYGITFDTYLTSPLIRTQQSAQSLGISDKWQAEPRLAERNRGDIQGLTKQQHQQRYPDSYLQMLEHPFHWVPPGGESILRVSDRLGELVNEFDKTSNYLLMTHRDIMWAAHVPIDGVGLGEIVQVDTNVIGNGHIFHYTNVNPYNGSVVSDELLWKQSVDPLNTSLDIDTSTWQDLTTPKATIG